MKTGKSDRKNTLLLFFFIVFSLVILESGLRLLTPFPIHGELANRVAHPVPGYTLDPADREIDATPFVLSAFQADTQSARIFYPRGDGHPFTSGYRSYALAAAALVRKIDEESKS